jgi:ectoine hydroxylase-related dioxygenase (phytanoyl-CoA dioxygenase family)
MTFIEDYARDGYAIVRQFLPPADVERIGAAIDSIHAEAAAHGRSFRHGNLFYKIADGDVRMAQWPSWRSAVLDEARTDPRFAALLRGMISGDIKQIINQIHWKRPGGKGDFAFHQDSRFRRPPDAYRNLGASYVQTGLVIDPHNARSGGMRILPGSHRLGALNMEMDGAVMDNAAAEDALVALGLDPAGLIDLELDPGDLALWSPYLVHGSGANRADHQRRFYINGYVRAADCDRGEWAFRDGQPVPLGPQPALVHYEQLCERPEPHFVD